MENINKLNELVETYGVLEQELKLKTKLLEANKLSIKELMSNMNEDEHLSSNYKAKISIQHRDKVNEDAMLEILIKDWLSTHNSLEDCPYIKTKNYIDMDELESALFNKQISKDTILNLDKCTTQTEVVTLRVSKIK